MVQRFGRILLLACAPLAAAVPAAAQVVAEHAWARATPPGAPTGAVYLTLLSPADDTLTGAATPAAAGVSVHEMSMEGTVMRMREVAGGLPLPANRPITLQPGGLHLMLTGLKTPLKRGDTLSVRLLFARSAPVEVQVPVLAIGAPAPAGAPVAAPTHSMAH